MARAMRGTARLLVVGVHGTGYGGGAGCAGVGRYVSASYGIHIFIFMATIYTENRAITSSRMARAWRGTSRLLVVIVYGSCGVSVGGVA